jgi:hypothetical protein
LSRSTHRGTARRTVSGANHKPPSDTINIVHVDALAAVGRTVWTINRGRE